MPAWLAALVAILSAVVAGLTLLAIREANRTGRLRFFFWHIPKWGIRDRSPTFFRLGMFELYFRGTLFAAMAVISVAFLFEAMQAR